MARYSNFSSIIGGMASCNINGRNISVINGEIYVDGVHYVPDTGDHQTEEKLTNTSGKMVEHIFDVSSKFSSIVCKGPMDVVFRQSANAEDFEVKGKMPENLIDQMIVTVENDTLYISMKSTAFNLTLVPPQELTIYVTNKTLKDVSSSGSGDFTLQGDFKASTGGLTVISSGSGDFKAGKILAEKEIVSLSTSGSGDVDLSGVDSKIFLVNISGSADVDCGKVQCDSASISIKGSGDVKISGATDTVEFSITGSGDIDAGGFKAKQGKASVAGSGDIRCNVERLSDRVRGSGDIHNRY